MTLWIRSLCGAPGPAVAHVQSTSTSTSPTAVRAGLPCPARDMEVWDQRVRMLMMPLTVHPLMREYVARDPDRATDRDTIRSRAQGG